MNADLENLHNEQHNVDIGTSFDQFDESLYPIEPLPHEKYSKSVVESEVLKLLNTEMETQKYNPVTCAQTSKDLCSKILAKVKELGYKRYKFVVQVVITSSAGQGIRVASRSLWDPAKDNYSSVVYKNASLKAVAVVFGCYFE